MTRPTPRPGLREVGPYDSPQLDVQARLNTNECSLPLPDAFADDLAAAVREVALNRYPDGTMREILRRRVLTGLIAAQFFPQSPIIVTGGNPQNGRTEAGQMRNMLMLLGFPANRILLEDKANSTVQNARFSVPLAKKAGTSGIILVTSSTHQGRADSDFANAGGNLLATVSYPDGNPTVNVVQFARDAMSPFINFG